MKTVVPITIDQDPRSYMGGNDLVLANQNHFPVVASERRGSDRGGLAMGAAGALALGALTLFMMTNARQNATGTRPATPTVAQPQMQPMVIPPGAETIVPIPPPPASSASMSTPSPSPLPMPIPTPIQSYVPSQPATALAPIPNNTAQSAQSPALILDGFAPEPAPAPNTAVTGGAAAALPAPIKGAPTGLSGDESFAFRVGESGVERARATSLTNPSTTVVQGTLIAAVLETGVNSDLPGYVRAFVSQDVRSFDNKHVLIPRGTRLIGQYKSGVAAGQTRVLVAWSRLLRADGVSVALASPGTDLAGETGLPGDVNSHFMKRFGAAILLSIVGGVASAGAGTVVVSGATNAASVAAQSNANIPPTIRVAQGQPIRIFTARDLDFSDVMASSTGK